LTVAPDRRSLIAAALALLLPFGLASFAAGQDDLRAARTKGDPAAPITIYEMSDFQCPWCGRFASETWPQLEREYVQTGKARVIFVNFPLPNHANAAPAAELAMCAARQGRFWPMHDLLFRHQARWSDLREPGSYFLALGDSARADRDALADCLRRGLTRDLVRRDAEGSARTGARSTPSFYIEGGLLTGAQPIEVFRQVLDSIYTAKTRAAPSPRR
jgi:protein-disulfide isomerase